MLLFVVLTTCTTGVLGLLLVEVVRQRYIVPLWLAVLWALLLIAVGMYEHIDVAITIYSGEVPPFDQAIRGGGLMILGFSVAMFAMMNGFIRRERRAAQ